MYVHTVVSLTLKNFLFDIGLKGFALGLHAYCLHVNLSIAIISDVFTAFIATIVVFCVVTQYLGRIPTFRRNMLPPSPRLKCVRIIYYLKRNDKIQNLIKVEGIKA
jgi:hypothetical protein